MCRRVSPKADRTHGCQSSHPGRSQGTRGQVSTATPAKRTSRTAGAADEGFGRDAHGKPLYARPAAVGMCKLDLPETAPIRPRCSPHGDAAPLASSLALLKRTRGDGVIVRRKPHHLAVVVGQCSGGLAGRLPSRPALPAPSLAGRSSCFDQFCAGAPAVWSALLRAQTDGPVRAAGLPALAAHAELLARAGMLLGNRGQRRQQGRHQARPVW